MRADRFQPSLSRLSRRATLPLCRQRSGLFSRDHWKDRIVCRSWSMFKCRQQHFPSKVMGSQGNAWGSTIGTKWNWTLACLLTSTHWYTLHWKHKSGSPERPRNAFHCLCLQSGKTIWANVLSICRIRITSNCCRHWPGSRETWRSPQLLQYSLRHFDLSQKQELLRLLSVLFHCFCVEATNCSCRVWYVLTLPRSSWWCSDSRGFLLGIGCVATLLEGLHCNE